MTNGVQQLEERVRVCEERIQALVELYLEEVRKKIEVENDEQERRSERERELLHDEKESGHK